jgi:hypothetical protein
LCDALDDNRGFKLLIVDPNRHGRHEKCYCVEYDENRVSHLLKKAKESLEQKLILDELKGMSVT